MVTLHNLKLTHERDVVAARQQGRAIAEALGFDHHDQIRFATAVSEIARNAFRYATGGEITFSLDESQRLLVVVVADKGNGIPHLDQVMGGTYRSPSGMGMGLIGTKRLMDSFSVEATPSGTTVRFGKELPAHGIGDKAALARVNAALARQSSSSPLNELQVQNTELLKTLNELRERKSELDRINAELQDTNRGVVALYAELDERADYLRRASELKSSFLSNMSHEFRTPLNSIMALTRMLLDRIDGELTQEQDQQLRYVQKSARELAEMVDDLLDLAKVEAGRLEVKPRAFDVADLFGALRGMLRPLLLDNTLNLVFEPAEGIPALFTDEQKVSQILRNFISNAIKFTPRGEVRVAARIEGEEIIFSVSDTGIGISDSDIRIIFEEFAQVDSSMQRKVKGTGLGLPLSRKLAELLGGRVEALSTVGEGSTFRLIVPCVFPDSDITQRTIALQLPEIEVGKKFVLIVEDNSETAFIYKRYLTAAGFQTYAVSTVEQAKLVLTKIRADVIVLDVLLRSETTWNFLRDLKSTRMGIPVLVMSVTDDEHRVFGMGADAFVQKPFVPEDMIGEIVRLTTSQKRRRVLMIDDNEVSRYVLRGIISEEMYEIFEARDGREGIRMVRELMPDLIFLDYFMPDLNGIDVLRDLRSSEPGKDTPIILHSTKNLDDSDRAFFSEHNVALFPKQMLSLSDAGERLRDLMVSVSLQARSQRPPNA
jgi:signal transduction histidine kinase/CheY-like chemotaxis protein